MSKNSPLEIGQEEKRPIGEDEGDPKVDGKGFRERFWDSQARREGKMWTRWRSMNLSQQIFNIPNFNITFNTNPYNLYNRDGQRGRQAYIPPIIEKKEEEIKIISLNTQRKMGA